MNSGIGRDKFIPHGTFSIERQGQLLLVDATGPFNHELISQLSDDLSEHEQALHHRPWVELAVMRCESAYTPEALNDLLTSMQRRHHNNMRAIAIQFEQPQSRLLTEHQLTSVLSKIAGLRFQFFDELEIAMDWCHACLGEYR
ncbi:hypothetical protein [Aestuariibacter salexigens]|uniref:hypothetical protein n=1 Tax=Aestuariibacter salexigens TaxID=226010 RepID=UPI0004081FF2|nr:hypothetical protein [Aestuariibacter salexigens]